ncbi:hypothetical protein PCANC_13027 [Puccinia coronata f. sp. avenae]|uniref:Uncharacterized protein n=1 Tax=Puccinia coronata f. sp. avenae TaxID=200324 RepID=A0A2N5USA2_9BASI|nr:hypothetical protein PCANC_13027 [Puccinia coronata f. sp. avenae]
MELSLNPGHSLGPIELGSLLWNVLSTLRAEQVRFKHVQICWEAEKPATGYILLSITSPPTRLLFEGVHQRLLLIEAHHSTSHERQPPGHSPALGEWIHYQNKPIAHAVGPNEPGVTLRVIHRLFGPTYPPAPHTSHQKEMVVSYPGVAFSFSHEVLSRVILSVQPIGEDSKGDEGEKVQLTEAYFRPRMPLYMSSIDGDLKSARIKLGRLDLEEPTLITFRFHSSSPNREIADVKVVVGRSTSEDILCEFGAPLRTFWKEDDRMKIHTHLRSSGRSTGQPEDPNPYFMSYFNLGVDFLIDPITNVVVKIVLHSNIPGEVLFARYSRCPWSLCSMDEDVDVAISTDKAAHINQQIRASFIQDEWETEEKPEGPMDTGKLCESFSSHAAVGSPDGNARKVSATTTTLSNMIEPAMLLDRTADVVDDGLVLTRPTRLYGHPGIVLEVTEDDDVETVWLF